MSIRKPNLKKIILFQPINKEFMSKKKINSRQRNMQRKQQKAQAARKKSQEAIKIREEQRLQEKLCSYQNDILSFEKKIHINAKNNHESWLPIYKIHIIGDQDSVCEKFYDKHVKEIPLEHVFRLLFALHKTCTFVQRKILLYEKGKLEIPKKDGDVTLEFLVDTNDNLLIAGNIGEHPINLADVNESLRSVFKQIYDLRSSALGGQLDKFVEVADSMDINLGEANATEQLVNAV